MASGCNVGGDNRVLVRILPILARCARAESEQTIVRSVIFSNRCRFCLCVVGHARGHGSYDKVKVYKIDHNDYRAS